ncbi:hypothetical protein [Streptomyces sp. SD31]|uniref:hypothetical protein n=1 Tax=Streptomyces sp. SD31 TaxID=3452208 RepID=UPI003F8BB313
MAWDILLHPEHGDVRGRQYDDRRALLADLLQEYDVGPPIQLVPMTDDPTVAMTWYRQLPDQGIEGIVAISLLDRPVFMRVQREDHPGGSPARPRTFGPQPSCGGM